MKWLQWLLDNAWSVVIVGGVLAQLLQAMMKKRTDAENSPPAGDSGADLADEDPELAERTRRIREEIQRKIAQRQGEPAAGTRNDSRPAAEDEAGYPPVIREVALSPSPEPATVTRGPARKEWERQAELLEQQAALAARLQEAKMMSEAAAKRTEFELATADHSAAHRKAARSALLADVESPEALRRAFVLREVLGPPLALRK